jgi:hypothetical protein
MFVPRIGAGVISFRQKIDTIAAAVFDTHDFGALYDRDASLPRVRASSPIGVATNPMICRRHTGSTHMRVLHTVVMIALLAGPAYGQDAVPRYGDVDKQKSPQQIESEREAERAYKRSLGNIPEQKASDPWGTVRSDSAPKAVAKDPPAKRTKDGGAAK